MSARAEPLAAELRGPVARLVHFRHPEERMAEHSMRDRPERYEDTTDPHNPPLATGEAPAVIAGLWYVLAPVGLILLVLLVMLLNQR